MVTMWSDWVTWCDGWENKQRSWGWRSIPALLPVRSVKLKQNSSYVYKLKMYVTLTVSCVAFVHTRMTQFMHDDLVIDCGSKSLNWPTVVSLCCRSFITVMAV